MKCVAMVCLLTVVLPVTNVFGDKIHLKSGEVVEGKVLEEDPDPVVSVGHSMYPLAAGHVYIVGNNGSMRQVPKAYIVRDRMRRQPSSATRNMQQIPKADIVRVEKELKPPEGIALLAKPDQWGSEKYGYQTQLIATSKEFVIGKPMTFSLVMRNVSDVLKMYGQQANENNSLLIEDPDGEEVYYKAGSVQTMGYGQPIDGGERVARSEDRDISQEYVIADPGTYTIQFREGYYGMSRDSWFPASNVLTFEVQPGEHSKQDGVILALKGILPEGDPEEEGWELETRWQPEDDQVVTPLGRISVKGFDVGLVWESSKADAICAVGVWQTEAMAGEKEGAKAGDEEVSEYLGQGAWGHFYAVIPTQAEQLWPAIRQDVKKALGLQ
jgi:hypothetical protein